MRNTIRTVFIVGVAGELIVLGFIVLSVWRNRPSVKGAAVQQITVLRKENIVYRPSGALKYFYESKPDTAQEEQETYPWIEKPVTYTINSDALNERYAYPIQASPSAYRIVTLGDSFTFGYYVNTKDNWPERLEDGLGASCTKRRYYDVINLGEPGYDTEYEVEKFVNRGAKYSPDLVIWFLSGYRWNELMTEKRQELEKTLTPADYQQAAARGDYFPAWTMSLDYVMTHYDKKQLFDMQQAIFDRFTGAYGGPLLIISFRDSDPSFVAQLKYFAHRRPQTYFFNGLPALSAIGGAYPDGHPNRIGHKAIAESVQRALMEKRLVPCR